MDLRRDNPVGRVPDFSAMRLATLDLTGDGWRLHAPGHKPAGGTWAGSAANVGLLRELLPVLDDSHELAIRGAAPESVAGDLAAFVSAAIARGTYVSAGPGSSHGGPHSGQIPVHDSALRAGDLAWDARAVAQRRHVLRTANPALPAVSMVLVTRRPGLVAPMVARIAAMSYPDVEIVVGLHGCPTPAGLPEAAGDRPLAVHEFGGDTVFGNVVDETFRRASGELVSKIDDDDFYGDDHIFDLVAAHGYSQATLVGKATTVVYLEALDATVRRVFGRWETYTHRVAGGTMLLSQSDLQDLGGWPAVPRGVDTGLLQRVQRAGGRVYYPHDVGYLYVRALDGGHTWETDVSHFLRNIREQWVGLLRHEAFGSA